MTVFINGSPVILDGPTNLGVLLAQQQVDRPGIAVAVNREVVRRERWAFVEIEDGTRVEILHAVAGG